MFNLWDFVFVKTKLVCVGIVSTYSFVVTKVYLNKKARLESQALKKKYHDYSLTYFSFSCMLAMFLLMSKASLLNGKSFFKVW